MLVPMQSINSLQGMLGVFGSADWSLSFGGRPQEDHSLIIKNNGLFVSLPINWKGYRCSLGTFCTLR